MIFLTLFGYFAIMVATSTLTIIATRILPNPANKRVFGIWFTILAVNVTFQLTWFTYAFIVVWPHLDKLKGIHLF